MVGRFSNGGSKDRFSSRVKVEENGLFQFQSLYQLESPLVLFSCTGGGCAIGRKGCRILFVEGSEGIEGIFGLGNDVRTLSNLSENFDSEGLEGIELGRVKTSVTTANIAMAPNN